MNISYRSLTAIVLGAAMLSGCGIYKKYELPTGESALIEEYGRALEQPADPSSFGNLDWRLVFTDPVLQDLIQQALDRNVNLENARLNVEIAQASLKGARLNFLPSVTLAPSGSLSHVFDLPGSGWSKTYQLPLAVSWEVDIFGKLLNADRGAKAQVLASEAYAQAVRSQIIAGVANCYYSLANLRAILRLQEETAQSWLTSVGVMEDFKLAGRVTEAAVVQSRAQYNGILANITDTRTSIRKMQNTMSLLLGVMPQDWNVSADAAPLSMPASVVSDGAVEMRQLASRPDVAAAEMNLAVAYYATNSARAAFYPGLSITANGGFTNSIGTLIMNPGKWFLNLAGQLTAPLFARGGLIANLEASKARQKQAMNTFENSIMSAAADVSDALTVYSYSMQKLGYVEEQVKNMELAVDYTQELLQLGTQYTTYLEVLTAQQNLLSAQTGLLSTRLNATLAVINLYQNLGGGR